MKLVGLLTFGKTSDLLDGQPVNGHQEQTFREPITAAWTVPELSFSLITSDGTGFPVGIRNEQRG